MSQETCKAAQQKIAKLLKRTKEVNEKCEKEKWECMKAKGKEKERQMKEQTKMKESPAKNVAAVSSVTIKTKCGCVTTVE